MKSKSINSDESQYEKIQVLTSTQRSLLSVLQDDTRCKILYNLNVQPSHPDLLVDAIGVSRTAIEKHLKLLLQYGILERQIQTYPRLRYVYSLTLAAQNFMDAISISSDQFINSTLEDFQDKLTQTEQAFIFGAIKKEEYESMKKDLEQKIEALQED